MTIKAAASWATFTEGPVGRARSHWAVAIFYLVVRRANKRATMSVGAPAKAPAGVPRVTHQKRLPGGAMPVGNMICARVGTLRQLCYRFTYNAAFLASCRSFLLRLLCCSSRVILHLSFPLRGTIGLAYSSFTAHGTWHQSLSPGGPSPP